MKDIRAHQHVNMRLDDIRETPTQLVTDFSQRIMLLPFEIMKQQLESMMLQQFEIATGIYSKQAEKLGKVLISHKPE